MYKASTSIRVRYAETDQMGVVYYGNYAQYFEVGRVEALRDLGMTYREMEEAGVMLPVVHLEIDYRGSALYDDLLTIETRISKIPGAKICFDHRVLKGEKVLTEGKVILVFMDKEKWKPMKAPMYFLDRLKKFF